MKFTDKIVLAASLCCGTLFTLGGSLMIIQNFNALLKSTIDQHISTHTLERYGLETKLLSQPQKEDLDAQATLYGAQLAAYEENTSKQIAIYTAKEKKLYSNIPEQLIENDFHHLVDSSYLIKRLHSKTFMLVGSNSQIGSHTYRIIDAYDISKVFHERDRQFQSFIILDIIILMLMVIVLYMLSRYLTRPIKKLNSISQDIANGNYQLRTNIHTSDEIGELSLSFDKMVKNIEENIQQLQLSIQQKEEFISNFSHEIKTPMTAIIGFADLLRSRSCEQATQVKASEYIYQEGRRLERLSYKLMDLLSLSDTKIALRPLPMVRLKKKIVEHFQPLEQTITLFIHFEDAVVRGDETLLLSVMINLIDNAIKAEPQNQQVHVQGNITPQGYELCVQDTGIGMEEETIQHVLQPFYMADKSRSRQKGGAGLGLSICAKILELHESELHISSKPFVGSEVKFILEVMHHA